MIGVEDEKDKRKGRGQSDQGWKKKSVVVEWGD